MQADPRMIEIASPVYVLGIICYYILLELDKYYIVLN